jgi:hypothetical protein
MLGMLEILARRQGRTLHRRDDTHACLTACKTSTRGRRPQGYAKLRQPWRAAEWADGAMIRPHAVTSLPLRMCVTSIPLKQQPATSSQCTNRSLFTRELVTCGMPPPGPRWPSGHRSPGQPVTHDAGPQYSLCTEVAVGRAGEQITTPRRLTVGPAAVNWHGITLRVDALWPQSGNRTWHDAHTHDTAADSSQAKMPSDKDWQVVTNDVRTSQHQYRTSPR